MIKMIFQPFVKMADIYDPEDRIWLSGKTESGTVKAEKELNCQTLSEDIDKMQKKK